MLSGETTPEDWEDLAFGLDEHLALIESQVAARLVARSSVTNQSREKVIEDGH